MPRVSPLLIERLARQGLAARPGRTAAEAAAVTTAVQAQDNQASRLGLRARAHHLTEDHVVTAIETDRTVVRFEALPRVLAEGPLDRHAFKAALAERGVGPGSPDPQTHTHAVVHASTTGLLCRGPDRGRHSTFALTEQWVPHAPEGPSGDDALAELARRYFTAFSPATAADFATWSGLGAGRAIDLIRDELTSCDVDGRPGFRLGAVEGVRAVRLLPAFDNYLLGYQDRAAMLRPERQTRVYRGGMISPTLVVDGVIAGRWALDRSRRTPRLTVSPFEALTRAHRRAVDAEAEDVARFLGRDVDVRVDEVG